MSRFFTGGGSESESESSSGDEEVQIKQPTQARTFQFSDDDEETKRVVRSSKDKRFDELRGIIKTMRNHMKIKDMSNVVDDFDDLGHAYDKSKKIVDKEGIPRFYIKSLVELENFVSDCWEDREGRKQMSKNNAKGLASLRQKLRKYNRDFETVLSSYRENPDEGDTEEEAEDEEAASSEDEDMRHSFSHEKEESSGSDEDSMWGGSSETESSTSEDEVKPMGQLTANYFRKKVPVEGEQEFKKKKDKDDKKKKIRVKKGDDSDAEMDGEWEQVKGGAPILMPEKPKMFSKDTEINVEVVIKKLHELVAARGKKGTDRSYQIESLCELRDIADGADLGEAVHCKITFCISSAIYDYNPNIATSMKPEMWDKCLQYIKELLTCLIDNSGTIVVNEHIPDDSETFAGTPPYKIRGCVLTLVERMDEEFTKMLQACDAHSTEYVERLRDEVKVCHVIDELQRYLEGRPVAEDLCRVYLKRILHLYYKFDYRDQSTDEQDSEVSSSRQLMDKMCKFIYSKDSTDRIRTRAILCHIFHHALHDRWYDARDLMLMSHLQDNILHSDIPTQILYNRAMVQLGLCAFRQGMIKDAHNCLVDIQSSGRAKELLAQGLLLQRQHERTPEQEKIEKRRQMPYHMHINLELLECVYLVSAMLLEIPYMAAHEYDARKKMISKNFHHVLRVSERQPLIGPPESMREHVVAACKAMRVGAWQACANFIINEKMNAKVWDLFYKANDVREMITRKIQEESLRTYLFSYSSVYDSLSLHTLSSMFELEWSAVHSIISKMIINEELMASLDEPTQTVVMHRTEPSRLQSLALQLSEKVAVLVESNERLMEMKTTGLGYFNYQRTGNQPSYQSRDQYSQQGNFGRRQNTRQKDGGQRYGH